MDYLTLRNYAAEKRLLLTCRANFWGGGDNNTTSDRVPKCYSSWQQMLTDRATSEWFNSTVRQHGYRFAFDESLELGIRMLFGDVINMCKSFISSVFYWLWVINMAMVSKFEVVSRKLNVLGICTRYVKLCTEQYRWFIWFLVSSYC